MGLLGNIKDFVRTNIITYLLFVYIFIVSSIIVNFVMLLTAIFIWPFSKELYRKINYHLAYLVWSQFTCVSQWFSNCECVLYMDPEDKKHVLKEHLTIIMNHTYEIDWLLAWIICERYGILGWFSNCDCIVYMDPKDKEHIAKEHHTVIMNHTYEIDWLLAWIVCERYGILGGTKIYGKQALALIPIIGWCWYFTESMFLKRDWRKDKEIIEAGLQRTIAYPDDYWVTLLLFPEGTRFTEEKHKASLEVAKMKGYPQYKYHLLPRTRGFVMSVQAMRGKKNVNAIYDCTMAFPGGEPEPSLMNVLRGREKKVLGHFRVKRHALEDLPETDDGLSEFLRNMFKEKDEVLDNFYKTGKMDLPAHTIPWRYYDLINWIFWALLTCIPLFSYLGSIFIAGTFFQKATVIILFTLASLLSRWMIGFSETHKGSSYGKEVKINNNKAD